MKVTETPLPGVLLIEPEVFGDARGFFLETYRETRYRDAGIDATFVQDNMSFSLEGVLRGLHMQNPTGQAKLVNVYRGEVFDVAVDVRVGSPTFGQWTGARLSEDNKHQLYVPEGFAHGFCVTSPEALFAYKCSAAYAPEHELAIRFDDPDIGIEWPTAHVEVSEKDQAAPPLRDIDPARLPLFLST